MDPIEKAPESKPAVKELGPIARWAIGLGLAVLLGFLGARFGIAPQPLPQFPAAAIQSQPQPIVIVVGGAPVGNPTVTGK